VTNRVHIRIGAGVEVNTDLLAEAVRKSLSAAPDDDGWRFDRDPEVSPLDVGGCDDMGLSLVKALQLPHDAAARRAIRSSLGVPDGIDLPLVEWGHCWESSRSSFAKALALALAPVEDPLPAWRAMKKALSSTR
jgi:hypothetical protein